MQMFGMVGGGVLPHILLGLLGPPGLLSGEEVRLEHRVSELQTAKGQAAEGSKQQGRKASAEGEEAIYAQEEQTVKRLCHAQLCAW